MQTHILVKVESFEHASAAAIGEPYVFATVDHGCVPDTAWQRIVDSVVIETTVRFVSQLAKNKLDL